MRKVIVLLLFLGLLSFPLMAQDYPKAEVFGGYQFLHLGDLAGTGFNLNTNGWDASFTGNLTKYFGVTGDFSGAYKSETVSGSANLGFAGGGTISGTANIHSHLYSYVFGPVLAYHEGRINPFVHALFGGAHASASGCGTTSGGATACGSGSQNGFAMMFGGGVDAKVNKLLSIRLAQVDYAYYRFSGMGFSKNVRVSTGLVLTF